MTSSVAVTVRGHWLNGWLLRLTSRPYVYIDGTEHAAAWGVPVREAVPGGTHLVGAGVRYRGSRDVLGREDSYVTVDDGEQTELVATNGVFNHQPFRLRRVGPRASA